MLLCRDSLKHAPRSHPNQLCRTPTSEVEYVRPKLVEVGPVLTDVSFYSVLRGVVATRIALTSTVRPRFLPVSSCVHACAVARMWRYARQCAWPHMLFLFTTACHGQGRGGDAEALRLLLRIRSKRERAAPKRNAGTHRKEGKTKTGRRVPVWGATNVVGGRDTCACSTGGNLLAPSGLAFLSDSCPQRAEDGSRHTLWTLAPTNHAMTPVVASHLLASAPPLGVAQPCHFPRWVVGGSTGEMARPRAHLFADTLPKRREAERPSAGPCRSHGGCTPLVPWQTPKACVVDNGPEPATLKNSTCSRLQWWSASTHRPHTRKKHQQWHTHVPDVKPGVLSGNGTICGAGTTHRWRPVPEPIWQPRRRPCCPP